MAGPKFIYNQTRNEVHHVELMRRKLLKCPFHKFRELVEIWSSYRLQTYPYLEVARDMVEKGELTGLRAALVRHIVNDLAVKRAKDLMGVNDADL